MNLYPELSSRSVKASFLHFIWVLEITLDIFQMPFIPSVLCEGGVWWPLWEFVGQKLACGSQGSNSGVQDEQQVPLPTDRAMDWTGTLFYHKNQLQQQWRKHSNGRKWNQGPEIKETLQFCCFVRSVPVCLEFYFFHLHEGWNPAWTDQIQAEYQLNLLLGERNSLRNWSSSAPLAVMSIRILHWCWLPRRRLV